jgi:hypothetical protein
MTSPESSISDRVFMKRTVEAAIRIGVIAGLIAWCFVIARPFLVPIVWGAIIAIAVFHGYKRLQTGLGGRRITAAVLVTLLMLVLLVVPSVLLGDSLVSGARRVVDSFQRGELQIPPPPVSVAGWPLIGEPLAKAWTLASENLEEALRQASPLLKGFGRWLLSAAAGAGLALLQFLLAILIAGAFLANSEAAGRVTRAVAKRLAGERGLEFAGVAEQTVRSVASGILGVALIQALLAGLGFLVAGVPAAGLLIPGLPCFWRDPAGRSNRVDPCSDLSVFNSGHGHRGRIPDLGHPSCTSGQYPQAPPTGPRRRRSHADHLRGRHRRLSQRRNHRPLYRGGRLGPRLQALSRLAGAGLDAGHSC